MATDTGPMLSSGLNFIKEEVDISDDEHVPEENEFDESTQDEPFMGEGLFEFPEFDDGGEDDVVPDYDPLGTDHHDMSADSADTESATETGNEENIEMNPSVEHPTSVEEHKIIEVFLESDDSMEIVEVEPEPEEEQAPIIITSVQTLRAECIAGSNANLKPASYRNLDVFRCFLCQQDFDTFDDFLNHRTKSRKHAGVTFDSELEKSFMCGVCQKPWNQPRKALACAVYGHDPAKIQECMFIHTCPHCPESHLGFHSLAAVGRHWATAHPEKMLPAFLYKSAGKDLLPSIKISPSETSSVTNALVQKNPNLVLENSSSAGSITKNDKNASSTSKHKTLLKVYKCADCERNFETRREVEIHQCLAKQKQNVLPHTRPKPIKFVCDDCGREFQSGRNLRLHLLRAGTCKKNDEHDVNKFPYKCVFCANRYPSWKSFINHRSKAHVGVPYNPALELPFACKICQKPALVEKQAMICALFAHDPSTLEKAMFKYKCTQCTSFGFHSSFALKRHWMQEHSNCPLPEYLQTVVERPLPTVYITLEQLLSVTRLRAQSTALVMEREIHPTLAAHLKAKSSHSSLNFIIIKDAIPIIIQDSGLIQRVHPVPPLVTKPAEVPVVKKAEVPVPVVKKAEVPVVRKAEAPPPAVPVPAIIIQESKETGKCAICGNSFKDMRRHMKTHDQSRFSGDPKHKCVCGKLYHLRNSLYSHWKTNKECKLKYDEEKVQKLNAKTDDKPMKLESAASSITQPARSVTQQASLITQPAQEYMLKIPSPPHSSFEDPNIKIEFPEHNISLLDQLEQATSEKSSARLPEGQVDLYTAFAMLDAAAPLSDATTETEDTDTIDFKNFIHVDFEEVKDEDDASNPEAVNISSDNTRKEPKKMRPSICLICSTGFPNQVMFMEHMSKAHKDVYRYKCSHCGKGFRTNDQRRKHETIHDPTRFNGEPEFACDQCDQKYHLKSSFETHLKVKHLGYKKPLPRMHLPVIQHRTIGAGDNRRSRYRGVHECSKCHVKFDFQYKLRDHIARVHTGEKRFKCNLCTQGFFSTSGLKSHKQYCRQEKKMASRVQETTETSPANETKSYACTICHHTFPKPLLLEQHQMFHTGEKPYKCDHCGLCFRLRRSLIVHKLNHESQTSRKLDNIYKCCVCGLHDFMTFQDLQRHRLQQHKNVPYDKEKERPFGCGVCQKPFFLKSQAMVCAILGHDPATLQEAMFKHKCPECPEERFGYHNFESLSNHWVDEHPEKMMPTKYYSTPDNNMEALPFVVINKEKAADIRANGPHEAYDFPLVIELDLLKPDAQHKDKVASPKKPDTHHKVKVASPKKPDTQHKGKVASPPKPDAQRKDKVASPKKHETRSHTSQSLTRIKDKIIPSRALTEKRLNISKLVTVTKTKSKVIPPEKPREKRPSGSHSVTDEDLVLSTIISREDALEAVKAIMLCKPSRNSMPRLRRQTMVPKSTPCKRKSEPPKRTTNSQYNGDSLAADRALGNKRIAGVLERIRSARAKKAKLN